MCVPFCRLDFVECKDGVILWRCPDCGDEEERYSDTGCGG